MNLEEFILPINYQKKIRNLDENVINDLELRETENNKSIYENIFEPKTNFGKNTMNLWINNYSYDKNFLNDTKNLIDKTDIFNIPDDISFNNIENIYKIIDNDKEFNNKYSYINFDYFKYLNQNELVLLSLSLYNISSPILSLISPIFLLLFPFLLIKMQGYDINIENYVTFLKQSFKQHALGALFSDFNSIKIEKKIYIIVTIIFYFYQMYQNIISCINYFKKLSSIHKYLFDIKDYINFSINKMELFYNKSILYKTYKQFNKNLFNHIEYLKNFLEKLNKILPYTLSFNKIKELGYLLKIFYNLKNDSLYLKSLKYSFYFNGYLENLSQLKINIDNNIINYSNNSSKIEFYNAYYPPLKNENPIKNSYKLNKHIIITGPNASGKTTLLKTTAINIILNQQIGCGFYSKANIKLFDFIHSYINIPDTSGRDSLFQAEARRCKEIIDKINKNSKSKKHLCIFDELYSGTNPYEAIGSAFSLIEYLDKIKNLNFVLTTHYTDLCNKLNNKSSINNCKMKVEKDITNKNFTYTYKLVKGISSIKGGTKVLNDLNYPKTIVKSINNVLNKIDI